MKFLLFIFGGLFCVSFSADAARSAKGKPYSAASATAVTTEVLEQWVSEVVPVIEKVTGRSFKHVPTVVFEELHDMRGTYVREAEKFAIRAIEAEGIAVTDEIKQAIRENVSTTSAIYRALFLPSTKTIFVNRSHFTQKELAREISKIRADYANKQNFSKSERGAFMRSVDAFEMKLLLAHELTHALQDQYGLMSFAQDPSANKSEAAQTQLALVEGHASFVELEVGKQMNAAPEILRYIRYIKPNTDAVFGPDQTSKIWEVARETDAPADPIIRNAFNYSLALDYIAFAEKSGGTAKVWDLLEHPPSMTSSILNFDLNPETNSDSVTRRAFSKFDIKKFFAKPDRWEISRANQIGALSVGTHLSERLDDSELLDKLVRCIRDGWCQTARFKKNGVDGDLPRVEVRLVEFFRPEQARAFFDATPAFVLQDQATNPGQMLSGVSKAHHDWLKSETGNEGHSLNKLPYERLHSDVQLFEDVLINLSTLSEQLTGLFGGARGRAATSKPSLGPIEGLHIMNSGVRGVRGRFYVEINMLYDRAQFADRGHESSVGLTQLKMVKSIINECESVILK